MILVAEYHPAPVPACPPIAGSSPRAVGADNIGRNLVAAIAAGHIGKADTETVALQVRRKGAIALGAVIVGHPYAAFTVAFKAKASSALSQ